MARKPEEKPGEKRVVTNRTKEGRQSRVPQRVQPGPWALELDFPGQEHDATTPTPHTESVRFAGAKPLPLHPDKNGGSHHHHHHLKQGSVQRGVRGAVRSQAWWAAGKTDVHKPFPQI